MFPPWTIEPPPEYVLDRERFGTLNDHCGICPKPPDESCSLNCAETRKALGDGVTVS